jgi:D-sedoheptulose 7-phosphate isomerase/D-glycero-D-manno-heptose 1,7-bisphosphate phosphatase
MSAAAADDARRRFPSAPYPRASKYFDGYAAELARAVSLVDPAALDQAAGILADAYQRGSAVFSCGNGGSAAIANHLQCDHLKGIRTATDLTPRVVSLSTSMELLTAIANDLGFENVFAYQLQSQATAGDVLMAISSSGRSPNIVRALAWARDNGLHTIALTGFDGGDARRLADVALHADITNYGIVEDLHQTLMHALAQYIRQSRMDPDTIAATQF